MEEYMEDWAKEMADRARATESKTRAMTPSAIAREKELTQRSKEHAEAAKLAAGIAPVNTAATFAAPYSALTASKYKEKIKPFTEEEKASMPVKKEWSSNPAQREKDKAQTTPITQQKQAAPTTKPASTTQSAPIQQKQTAPVDDGWKIRIKNAKASDADIKKAYEEWKAGRYTPGPLTMAEFKKMGLMDTPSNKLEPVHSQSQKDVDSATKKNQMRTDSLNQFVNNKGWSFDTAEDIRYSLKKQGYSPEEVEQYTKAIQQQMFNLGKNGQVTKNDLKKLLSGYGINNVSQLDQTAKLINNSYVSLGQDWSKSVDGSYSPNY